MANESNPIKTLTINGVKYKLKGSVEAIKCDEITITPDNDGTADVQALFSSDNTSLNTAKHYDLKSNSVDASSQLVMLDQTTQYVAVSAAFTLKVPASTVAEGSTNKARDMVVYVTNEGSAAVLASLDTTVEWHYDGESTGISVPVGVNAIYISEVGINSSSQRVFVAKLWTPAKSQAVSA